MGRSGGARVKAGRDTQAGGLGRRQFLQAALAGAGLWATGCGLVTPARGGRGVGPLSLLADTTMAPALQAVAEAFTASPGARARPLVQIAEPSLADAYQAMLTGTTQVGADVSAVTPSVLHQNRYAPTLMVNVGPALKQTGLEAGIYPQLLAYGRSGGLQVILPLFRDPLVVFFNSDAFSRAGVDPPAVDWTFAKFQLYCQQLKQKAVGLVAPVANLTTIWDVEILTAFIEGFGGQTVVANTGAPGYRAAFAEPAAVEGVDALVALHPYEPAAPSAQPVDLFAQGAAAMYFGHHRDVGYLINNIGEKFAWDVAPLPRFPLRRVQPVQADGVAALAGDPDRRAAAVALALFVCTPDAQRAAARTGLGVPALTALADSPLWRQNHINNDVFVANTDADVIVPEPLYYLTPLELAIGAIVRGAVPAYDALAQAQQSANWTLANS